MNKVITSILALSIILASFSISYYFLILLPHSLETKRTDELAVECKNLYYERTKKDGYNELGTIYTFDKTEKLCLYNISSPSENGIENYLIDLFTNQTIASYTYYRFPSSPQAVETGDKNVYKDKFDKYFNK